MKKFALPVIFLVFFCLQNIFGQQISSQFWGINHWMPKKYINYPTKPNGAVEDSTVQKLVQQDGCIIYRIAGTGYDTLGTAIGTIASDNDYISAITAVKLFNPNAKFIIQVPFKSGIIDSFQAGQLVFNIRAAFSFGEKFYYEIGNEWDRYKKSSGVKYSSLEMKNIIKSYALEMKKVDTTIRIIAPALSSLNAVDSGNHRIMKRLIGGADDITGKITGTGTQADGHFFVDIVDYHTYAGGNNGNLDSINSGTYNTYRDSSINYPKTRFAIELDSLQAWLTIANAPRLSSPLTFAITEMNICWKNPPPADAMANNKYTNSPEGLGCRSFFSGQYLASMTSAMLRSGTAFGKAKIEFFAPWSIHEAGGKGTFFDLGMTKDSASQFVTPIPLSTYYHYQLMSKHYFGKYAYGFSNKNKVQTFASVETGVGFYIMILNQDTVDSPFNIGFANNTGNASLNLTYNFIPAPDTTTYNDVIEKNSTMLLQFNCHGSKIMKIVYSLQDAINDVAPHLNTAFATICSPSTSIQENASKTPQMLIYPNPGSGAFSLNFTNAEKGNYTLSIHDVLGRLISERKLDFNVQKTVTFEINSKGFYFVSLQNGNNRYAQKVLVQ